MIAKFASRAAVNRKSAREITIVDSQEQCIVRIARPKLFARFLLSGHDDRWAIRRGNYEVSPRVDIV